MWGSLWYQYVSFSAALKYQYIDGKLERRDRSAVSERSPSQDGLTRYQSSSDRLQDVSYFVSLSGTMLNVNWMNQSTQDGRCYARRSTGFPVFALLSHSASQIRYD